MALFPKATLITGALTLGAITTIGGGAMMATANAVADTSATESTESTTATAETASLDATTALSTTDNSDEAAESTDTSATEAATDQSADTKQKEDCPTEQ